MSFTELSICKEWKVTGFAWLVLAISTDTGAQKYHRRQLTTPTPLGISLTNSGTDSSRQQLASG